MDDAQRNAWGRTPLIIPNRTIDSLYRLWYAALMSLIVAQGAHAMSSNAGGDRELSLHDAPYWITITIPESRDTFWNRALSGSGRFEYTGRRAIADIAFIPPGGEPPNTAVMLFVFDRYKVNDESLALPLNPTPQQFVMEYKARWAHFNPSLAPAQLEAGNVSTLRLGDRNWFRFNMWNDASRWIQYVTIIDDKKMLVLEWVPPRDTFFKRKRAAKKQPEIEALAASVRISSEPGYQQSHTH